MTTRALKSTTEKGLDHDSLPMKLWHQAKKLGVWDPRDIDFRQDREDWKRMTPREQDLQLRLTALFQAGEESVALDILPLLGVMAQEGRLEEEMYLTSFLWEEAKHVELFRRFFDEVAEERGDLNHFLPPSYRTIFYEALPSAMNRLRTDASPVAQAEASITYNMIVEGVLAETGYYAYEGTLRRNNLMPGMQQAIAYLRRDEARHIGYGVYLLSRLLAEHGDPVWDAIEARMNALLEPSIAIINEIFVHYEGDIPFGLQLDDFLGYALSQFQNRIRRIEAARGQSLPHLQAVGLDELGA